MNKLLLAGVLVTATWFLGAIAGNPEDRGSAPQTTARTYVANEDIPAVRHLQDAWDITPHEGLCDAWHVSFDVADDLSASTGGEVTVSEALIFLTHNCGLV